MKYEGWDVCKGGVLLGKKEKVGVYNFVKEGLIGKLGGEWYEEVENVGKEVEGEDVI